MKTKLIGSFAVLFACIAFVAYWILNRWLWLNDPQRDSAIQAATAIILGLPTLIFAVFACVAALQSAEASQAQARAADAQADSSRSQTRVADLQLEISKATLKEQTRPILNLKRIDPGRTWYGWGQSYEITNTGSGAAHRIEVAAIQGDRSAPWGTDRTTMDFMVAPGQSSPLLMRGGGYTYLRFFYESLAGHRYVSTVSTFAFTPQEEMVTIYVENNGNQRSVDDTDFDAKTMSQWQMAQRDLGAPALQ